MRTIFKPKRNKRLVLWIILVFIALTGKSQAVYQLSVDNALQSNYVRSLIQDRYGYVWMATTSGLARYDGYQTEYFLPMTEGNGKLLQDFRILDIKWWNNRFVWIRLRGRLYSCYDTVSNKFIDFTGDGTYNSPIFGYTFLKNGDMMLWNDKGGKLIHFNGNRFVSTQQKFPKGNVLRYLQGEDKEYIIYTDGRIYLKRDKKYINQNIPAKIMGKRKVEVAEYFHGTLYLISGGKLYEWNPKTGKLNLSKYYLERPQALKDNKGNLILVSSNGNDVYYLTKKMVYHFGGVYSQALLKANTDPHYTFFTSSEGLLWISTYGNGVFSYNPKTAELKSYANYLPSPYTFGSMEDQSGNMWVVLENMGVCVMNFSKSYAKYLYSSDNNKYIDHIDDIRMLRLIDGNVYVANMQNGFLKFTSNLSSPQTISEYGDDITAITKDKAGRLCVGTRKNGIYINEVRYINEDEQSSIKKSKVSDLITDHKGRLWATRFDTGLDVLVGTSFKHIIESKYLQLRNMELDRSGRIWIASSQGAIVFNPDLLIKDKKAYQVVHVSATDHANDEIHSILCDSRGRIWIGSIGNGVKMIYQGKSKIYTTRDGLVDNNVQSIVEDRRTGDIWFGTDNGLSRLRKGIFSNFYFGANTLANSCTEDNAIQLPDGSLAFATHNGILTFNPKDIKKDCPNHQLAITKIEANGVSVETIEKGVDLQGPLGKANKVTSIN